MRTLAGVFARRIGLCLVAVLVCASAAPAPTNSDSRCGDFSSAAGIRDDLRAGRYEAAATGAEQAAAELQACCAECLTTLRAQDLLVEALSANGKSAQPRTLEGTRPGDWPRHEPGAHQHRDGEQQD